MPQRISMIFSKDTDKNTIEIYFLDTECELGAVEIRSDVKGIRWMAAVTSGK